jgi:hypothetical protein
LARRINAVPIPLALAHNKLPVQETSHKVVAHVLGGKLVKGFLKTDHGPQLENVLQHHFSRNGCAIPIHAHENNGQVAVGLETLKAIFFVKTFEGRSDYQEVKFFDSHPAVEGLWVQVRFADGELTEGILQNSIRYLIEPGFLLKPPDPLSNNEFVYVLKKSLKDFRILGVRDSY